MSRLTCFAVRRMASMVAHRECKIPLNETKKESCSGLNRMRHVERLLTGSTGLVKPRELMIPLAEVSKLAPEDVAELTRHGVTLLAFMF